MKRLLFALFPDRRRAAGAATVLESAHVLSAEDAIRLHERELDPMMGVDLAGTETQGARERNVVSRFGAVFGVCAAAGLAADLSGVFGDTGLSGTMALGSLGILLGTLVVVMSAERPLDEILDSASDELRRGRVLLTVAVDPAQRERVSGTLTALGGREIYDA